MSTVSPPRRKPRHKYRFRSRAEAEEAQAQGSQEAHRMTRFARALLENRVQWVPNGHQNYRVGRFDLTNCAGPRYVVVFQPPRQAPNPQVFDADDWADYCEAIRRHRSQLGPDLELDGLLQMIDEIDRLK